MIKKVLKFIGILLLIIIIAAVAIPYFFKDEIVEAVKKDINKNFNAVVEFEDVNLSLFKSFPDFNFALEKLSITGINEFEGFKLMEADNIEFSLDLMSVISDEGPVEINTIYLQKPSIHVKVLRNGKANYDIVKANEAAVEDTDSTEYNFLIQLKEYAIVDGNFIYDDRLGDTYVKIEDLDHSGKGAFTQDVFDISTTTDIKSMTAKSGGVTYLSNAKGDLDLNLNADMTNSTYTIKDNSLAINALQLNTEGFVQMMDDKIKMDIKYSTPKNNFKSLLSMIPSAYTADFKDVEADGSLALNGYLKGNYDLNTGSLPAFLVNLKVDNGSFKYPDLPLGVQGIQTTTKVSSPSADLDDMIIDISNFQMKLGNNPFEAKAKLWTLLSDPSIDSEIKGTIDLAELAKAFPLEGIQELNGIITSNLTAKTSMSAIDAQDYENIDMAGDLRVQNLNYQAEATPQIQVANMAMNFSPQYVRLDDFTAQIGKSDIKAEGTLDNILAYFAPDKTMTGKLKFRSQLLDANEWITEEAVETSSSPQTTLDSSENVKVFDRFDFALDGAIDRILYDIYDLRNSKIKGQLTPNKAILSLLQTNIGESDFTMDGQFTNVFDYIFENETLYGDIKLTSKYINANEFLEEETPEEALEVIPVPEKMDLNISAEIDEVLYTNIPLRNITGEVKVVNETATLKNATARSLGGEIMMNGSYNTQNLKEPKFDMDYQMKSLKYQDAFAKLNTFQAFAPIGKYIEGEFNTNFQMSGILGNDMFPVLNTISARGVLETLNGQLKNFTPLQKLADKLNLNALKSVDLKNTKNWFELNNGEVEIKDFDYETNGIAMVIGGKHSLENDMAYSIKAKVPRNKLSQSSVGQAADKGLSFLQNQASQLGINIDQGEFINIDILISGTITNPKIKLNLLGMDGKTPSISDIADNIKDKAIDKVSETIEDKTGVDVKNIKQEVEEVKEDLSAKADAEIAELMKKTKANIAKITTEAEKRAKQAKEEAKKLSDKTKAEGYKQADELIKKAGGNPFKKKAAELAANKLRKTTDEKAADILKKGDDTASAIMNTAKEQTDKLEAEAEEQAEEIRKKYE